MKDLQRRLDDLNQKLDDMTALILQKSVSSDALQRKRQEES